MSELLKVRIGYGLGTRTNLHDESYGVCLLYTSDAADDLPR